MTEPVHLTVSRPANAATILSPDEPFVRVDDRYLWTYAVRNSNLTATARLVAFCLSDRWYKGSRKVRATYKQLGCDMGGKSHDTVGRAVKELTGQGFVLRHAVEGWPSEYELLLPVGLLKHLAVTAEGKRRRERYAALLPFAAEPLSDVTEIEGDCISYLQDPETPVAVDHSAAGEMQGLGGQTVDVVESACVELRTAASALTLESTSEEAWISHILDSATTGRPNHREAIRAAWSRIDRQPQVAQQLLGCASTSLIDTVTHLSRENWTGVGPGGLATSIGVLWMVMGKPTGRPASQAPVAATAPLPSRRSVNGFDWPQWMTDSEIERVITFMGREVCARIERDDRYIGQRNADALRRLFAETQALDGLVRMLLKAMSLNRDLLSRSLVAQRWDTADGPGALYRHVETINRHLTEAPLPRRPSDGSPESVASGSRPLSAAT